MRWIHVLFGLLACSSLFAGELGKAVRDGDLILNVRFRIESVDQDAKPKEALAPTIRTRLGWKTASWRGWSALLDFENIL